MDYRTIKNKNYNLHIINTDKFKTINLMINFKRKIKKEEITIRNLLNDIFEGGKTDAYEIGIKTQEENILLPCGASGIKVWEE